MLQIANHPEFLMKHKVAKYFTTKKPYEKWLSSCYHHHHYDRQIIIIVVVLFFS